MAESETPYRFEEADTYCTIVLLPELNQAPWDQIDSMGTAIVERMNARMGASRQKPGFIVDLSALNYMGSAMVALVVRLWKASKEKGAKMAVVNSDPMVLEVLELAGLAQVWTIVDSREAAMKTLGVVEQKTTAADIPVAPGASEVQIHGHAAPAPNVTTWIVLTILFLLATGAGVFVMSSDPMPIDDMRVTLGLLFGGGLLGLITSTVCASLGRSMKRTIGLCGILGAIALLATGVYVHPHRKALLQGRDVNANDANNDDKTNPKKSPNEGDSKSSLARKNGPAVAPKPGKKTKSSVESKTPKSGGAAAGRVPGT